jgi:hypothetical protein
VFEKEGRGVFLPYAEFIKLWQKARPTVPPKPKPKPPFEAAISAGSYEGVVDGTAATITAIYNVEMLKEEGWAALPLPLSGVAVTESTIEGGKAILNVTDQGYVMLMEKPGIYKLTMKFVVRVDRQPGKNSFTFNCPRAAVSRLQMTLPGSDLSVKVDPLLVASSNAAADGKTVVQAFLGSTNKLSFEWRPKTVQKGQEDSLRFANQGVRSGGRASCGGRNRLRNPAHSRGLVSRQRTERGERHHCRRRQHQGLEYRGRSAAENHQYLSAHG